MPNFTGRSPDLRFNGPIFLPIPGREQWIPSIDPPRLQWRGRAGFSPASQFLTSKQLRLSEINPRAAVLSNEIYLGAMRVIMKIDVNRASADVKTKITMTICFVVNQDCPAPGERCSPSSQMAPYTIC